MSKTPGQAKNAMRCALRAVVDPEPTKKEICSLWEYFGSACAYCGLSLKKENREGHIDHLIPATKGGVNHISNRVLSCSICNGNEKRESPWLEFLTCKVKAPSLFESRKNRIEKWTSLMSPSNRNVINNELLEQVTNNAIEAFDNAVDVLRRSRE
jgi:CRISPR/Cas system Type II protein with McrA/HNH and RuvC-like nuclease domain